MRALYGVRGPHQFQTGTFAGGPPSTPTGAGTGFDLGVFVLLRLCQPCGKIRGEEVGEAFGEVRALHLVVHDPEAGEDGLVELSADVGWSAEVQLVRVGAEHQRLLDHLHDGLDLSRALVDDLLCLGKLAGDAFLLRLQVFERDGIGVAHLDQLELLVLQFLPALLLSVEFGSIAVLSAHQRGHDLLADGRDARSAELDAGPVVRDGRFHVTDQDR